MSVRKRIRRALVSAVVLVAQVIAALAVTFFASLIIRADGFQQTRAVLFALVVGAAFSTGIFLAGSLAIAFRLLPGKPRYLARLGATVLGV